MQPPLLSSQAVACRCCLQACYGADHDVAGLRDVLQQRMNEPISQQELNVLVLHPQRGFPWLNALPTASRCKF